MAELTIHWPWPLQAATLKRVGSAPHLDSRVELTLVLGVTVELVPRAQEWKIQWADDL